MRALKQSNRSNRKILFVSLIVITLALSLSGCRLFSGGSANEKKAGLPKSTTTTVNARAESLKIEPSSDMAQFFSAIKGAERVIFIKEPTDKELSEADQVPLSVFDISERTYWDVTGAAMSAVDNKELEVRGLGIKFLMRWYKRGYKKVGEAIIHSGTGELTITYLKTAEENELHGRKLYLGVDKLEILKKAADKNKRLREDTGTADDAGTVI